MTGSEGQLDALGLIANEHLQLINGDAKNSAVLNEL